MSDQNTEVVEKIDETAAADTLKPSPSKAEMLATFTSLMAQLGKEDLSKFLNDALAQIGKEAEKTPSATAPGQTGLGQMPMPKLVAKEDVEEMFAGETLTEEFKEKTVTIFEAAVNARLTIEKARLEEETEKKIEEAVALFQDDLSSKVDQYMDYVVETWVKENEIALVESLRSEIAEEFIGGLHKLFTESYINIPEEKEEKEEKVDEAKKMKMKMKKMEEEINEAYSAVKFLRTKLSEVNLLNAKLLYVNKLFRNNLTETQKVKIIETFDRAKTVREAKLVYATLSESITAAKGSTKQNATKKSVMEWARLAYESVTGRAGYSDFYKKDITFNGLGPVGDVLSARGITVSGAHGIYVAESLI